MQPIIPELSVPKSEKSKSYNKCVLLMIIILSLSMTTFSILLLWNNNRIGSYWNDAVEESVLELTERNDTLEATDSAPFAEDLETLFEDSKTIYRSDHAISFSPDMQEIRPLKFKKSDKDIVPGRYLSSNDAVSTLEYQTFTILPKSTKCETSKILITVKSATDHFEHRMSVRESWSTVDNEDIEIFFLLGKSASIEINEAIEEEAEQYDDIIQGAYQDTYSNLTLKALNGLEFRKVHCSQPDYILAIDDDTYVDLPSFKTHLQRLKTSQNFIECSERTVVNGKVWRQGRWAVPEEEYPADKYPTYCNGPCYLMPKETSDVIHQTSKNTIHDLQADDALLTGVFRSKAEIPLIQYTRTASPGWCRELNNRKPRLPQRMRREFDRTAFDKENSQKS